MRKSLVFFFQAAENQSLPTQPDNKTGTRCVIYQMREEQEEILWRQNPQKIVNHWLINATRVERDG